jgi:thymidylate synthase (FAD)
MKKRIEIYNDGIGAVEYVDHMGSDLTVVNAARVSFGKEKLKLGADDEKLIKYLINHNHTSTLEHNLLTFRFKVPLFIRSQHHRHRTWSFNEISRRYTEENLEFFEPNVFRTQHKSNRQSSNLEDQINPQILIENNNVILANELIKKHHQTSLNLYNNLLTSGICREQARGVLPQNLYTEYYGTVNLNNLLKFVNLRTHKGAQKEIELVANACLEIAEDLWPISIKSWKELVK